MENETNKNEISKEINSPKDLTASWGIELKEQFNKTMVDPYIPSFLIPFIENLIKETEERVQDEARIEKYQFFKEKIIKEAQSEHNQDCGRRELIKEIEELEIGKYCEHEKCLKEFKKDIINLINKSND